MSCSYAPLPVTLSSSRAEVRPGPLLLEEHCTQSSPVLADNTVHAVEEDGNTSYSNISALELSQLIADPGEIMNASFPRVSALLTDAQAAMNDRRFEELCADLEQVSATLHALIEIVIPGGADNMTPEIGEIPEPVATAETIGLPVDAPGIDLTEKSNAEEHQPRRAMAAAA